MCTCMRQLTGEKKERGVSDRRRRGQGRLAGKMKNMIRGHEHDNATTRYDIVDGVKRMKTI
jgi:hypothetical protein